MENGNLICLLDRFVPVPVIWSDLNNFSIQNFIFCTKYKKVLVPCHFKLPLIEYIREQIHELFMWLHFCAISNDRKGSEFAQNDIIVPKPGSNTWTWNFITVISNNICAPIYSSLRWGPQELLKVLQSTHSITLSLNLYHTEHTSNNNS